MAAVWAAASYSKGGFSLFRAGIAWHVMVPGGITLHLEPGTWNNTSLLEPTGTRCLRCSREVPQIALCLLRDRGGGDV